MGAPVPPPPTAARARMGPPTRAERSAAEASRSLPARGDMLFAWGRWVRSQDVRLAAAGARGKKPELEAQLLFCPHSSSLQPDHPDFER